MFYLEVTYVAFLVVVVGSWLVFLNSIATASALKTFVEDMKSFYVELFKNIGQ